MANNHINELFKAIAPNEDQKEKMWTTIEQSRHTSYQSTRKGRIVFRKILISLSASLLLILLSATTYAAVSGDIEKMYDRFFKGKGQTVTFANGDSLHYEINGNSRKIMGGDGDSPWLVKKSWGRLIASVNGEKIDITDALKKKGYFYYNYRDEANILHRLFIVKNAGGTKDYAERWYSQIEWLPELGMTGGRRGLSGPLSDVIVRAQWDAEDGKYLDAALKEHLEKYWKEYGN